MGKVSQSKDSTDTNYIQHLVELRKRFVISLVFFILTLTLSFFFVPQIIEFIRLTSGGVQIEMNIFNVTDSLYLYMRVASLMALILTMPFLLFQLWLFIKPGLEKKELRFVRRYLPMVFFLFMTGIAFAYFVILPYYVVFASALAITNGFVSMIGAKAYIDFVVKTVWPFGVAFELPVLVYILSGIGIVNDKLLKAIRGYAYIGLMVISAFLTPPDPISMGIMLVPLAVLYESSVILSKRSYKRFHKSIQIED